MIGGRVLEPYRVPALTGEVQRGSVAARPDLDRSARPYWKGWAMIRRLLSLLLMPACALAVVVLTPLGAQAQQSAVTITIASKGTLARSRVVVTVPVQISCDLSAGQPGPIGSPFSIEGGATILQAVGRLAIASGSGFTDQPIVCDGTPHSNTVTLVADASGPPFHTGAASVTFSLFIEDFSGNSESGSSGPQTVSLKR
jgi:hypothetical protein